MADRRSELLDGAVAYVLREGIGSLTLRPLADALGTSDRMLLYYFGTRDVLVAAVLGRVGADLREVVETALPPGRSPPAEVLAALAGVLGDRREGVGARLRLWLEVAGLAAQGEQPHRDVAGEVLAEWLRALGDRLDVDGDPAAAAAALLCIIDGAMLLDALGHAEQAAAGAAWLLGALADGTTGP